MRPAVVLAVCVVALIFVAGSLFAGDWPAFRGPKADGISPETGINRDWKNKPPKELWRVEMHDRGYSGPSVVDGKVFIIDHKGSDDVVRAINLAAGKDIWSFTYPDSDKENLGFSRATPLVENGRVYAVSMLGVVHCLDAKTGAKIWSRNIIKDFTGTRPTYFVSASPVIDGDRLIVYPGGQDASVAALNKDTGETLWRGGGSDMPAYATPVVATLAGKKQYVVLTTKTLLGVDAESGKVLWTFPYPAKNGTNVSTPVVVGENRVFITSLHMNGCVMVEVSAAGARAAWTNQNINALVSTPVYCDGYLYGNRAKDSLVCVDAATGARVWEQTGFEHGGLIAADGTIIAVNGKTGTVVMVEMSPKGYKELGRIDPFAKVEKSVWTAPVVAEGKVLVRDTRVLVCFDLKP